MHCPFPACLGASLLRTHSLNPRSANTTGPVLPSEQRFLPEQLGEVLENTVGPWEGCAKKETWFVSLPYENEGITQFYSFEYRLRSACLHFSFLVPMTGVGEQAEGHGSHGVRPTSAINPLGGS